MAFKFPQALRALHHRNYRLFFLGQMVSLTGTWVAMVASSWLVFRLSHGAGIGYSAFVLGLTFFAQQIPVFFLSPFIGVYTERRNNRRILIVTQCLLLIFTFALAYLTLGNWISIEKIIAINFLRGIVHAFDISAQQTIVVDLIEEREDLANAIALNSMMIQLTRLTGPSLAGFLVYHWGEGICFLLDGFSYFAVVLCLLLLKVNPRTSTPSRGHRAELMEGLAYAWNFQPIRSMLLHVGLGSLLFACQPVFMPLIAFHIHEGGERLLGVLYGASGLGAALSAFFLARRKSIIGLGKVLVGAFGGLGIGFILLGLSEHLALALLALLLTGASSTLIGAISNTGLQTLTEDGMRGRIMSLFSLAVFGMAPLGSLLAGVLAEHAGLEGALALAGVCAIVSGLLLHRKLPSLRETARPVLARKGIILPMPEQY
jgi:MFS family permease